jgi:hypothetical protein
MELSVTFPRFGVSTATKQNSRTCSGVSEKTTMKTGIPNLWQGLSLFRRQRYRQTNISYISTKTKPSWVTDFFHLKLFRLLFVTVASLTASAFRQGTRVQFRSQPGVLPFYHRTDTDRVAWDRTGCQSFQRFLYKVLSLDTAHTHSYKHGHYTRTDSYLSRKVQFACASTNFFLFHWHLVEYFLGVKG